MRRARHTEHEEKERDRLPRPGRDRATGLPRSRPELPPNPVRGLWRRPIRCGVRPRGAAPRCSSYKHAVCQAFSDSITLLFSLRSADRSRGARPAVVTPGQHRVITFSTPRVRASRTERARVPSRVRNRPPCVPLGEATRGAVLSAAGPAPPRESPSPGRSLRARTARRQALTGAWRATRSRAASSCGTGSSARCRGRGPCSRGCPGWQPAAPGCIAARTVTGPP